MSIKIDKGLILNNIMNHLGIKKKSDFAKFLGIAPTTLSSWYARNAFDKDLIYSKCEFLNPIWLLTGEGEMLKNDSNDIEISKENINMKTVENLSEVNLKLTNEIIEIRSENKQLIEKIKLLEEELRQLGKDQDRNIAI